MSDTNERGDARHTDSHNEPTDGSRREDDSRAVRSDGGTAQGRNGQNRAQGQRNRQDDHGPGDWFAHATIQWLLALVGVVVVLFGLGQAVGVSLLGMVADALGSQTGQWLMVAFLGLLVILAAAKIDWR
ncbi:hypothetical protein [Halorussus halophilus]|uniref:hypothetical protein n=1 Tax=Halorussus halophilus TaxID=2650975 RepID=UPI0013012A2B|nr:hypothetical protein [Halorussus halophilus]